MAGEVEDGSADVEVSLWLNVINYLKSFEYSLGVMDLKDVEADKEVNFFSRARAWTYL